MTRYLMVLGILVLGCSTPALAQVFCVPTGSFTYCETGAGQSSIQADLGHGRGAIIDNVSGTTTPYTIIQPTPTAKAPILIPKRTPKARVIDEPVYQVPSVSAAHAPTYYLPPTPYPYGMGE